MHALPRRFGCLLLLLLPLVLPSPVLAVEPVPGQNTTSPIIDGDASPPGGQPWIVALVRRSPASQPVAARQLCGGTLIAPDWVVTAAHCVVDLGVDEFDLVVGREDLAGTDGEVLHAAEVIVHPYYARDSLNDIALVRLQAPSSAQFLRRATPAEDLALMGKSAALYGWGFHSFRDFYDCNLNFIDTVTDFSGYWCESKVFSFGYNPAGLEEGSLRLASYPECDARFREYLLASGARPPLPETPYFSADLTPHVLCAWDPGDTHTACFGDSGGPLVAAVGGTPVLLGVVSFSYEGACAVDGQLSVFARVSWQAPFIDEAMQRDPRLGFDALCPRTPVPDVQFRPLIQDVSRVTVSWPEDAAATGWRLYYAGTVQPGAAPAKIDLGAAAHSYDVNLRQGQQFYLALQARGAACDSALSPLRKVVVPGAAP